MPTIERRKRKWQNLRGLQGEQRTGRRDTLSEDTVGELEARKYSKSTPWLTAQFAGEATDEVIMGLACWMASKYAKGGFIGSMARKGLVVENARVGEIVANKGLSMFGMSNASKDTSNSQSW
jgi:hypothetical protein